ncbi:uncharacterized protein Ecym_2532 [Eremothecium cymbalariae DBVPG|uniref:Uncharacterized protein n=1 Tax=Eremothecium cymbalariae (strain CBS 270.75 / DBVPG 7215 / KCTC 17166 / NRRL Y-17582) TaxID=931890 RepID=G8JQ95_ERECY|nr:Hypothetical protein Ecym_2532 [Eremothecium cymbalariae DBVPG\
MGYVVAGYATRRLRHYDDTVVYYPPFKRVCVGRSMRFEDLPRELIQQIFVISGNRSLAVCSRFLYECLRPRASLIGSFLKANYMHDVNKEVPKTATTMATRIKLLDTDVFNTKVFLGFLNSHHNFLDGLGGLMQISAIYETQRARRVEFEQGGDVFLGVPKPVVNEETGKPALDFPQPFYTHPYIYFCNNIEAKPPIYNQFLLKIHKYFAITQPEYLTDRILHWFFYESQDNYNVNHLLHAINLALHLSSLSVPKFTRMDPMLTLVNHLFVENIPGITKLLLATNETLVSRKYRIVEKFIRKFYKGHEELLSDDTLWQLLNNTKDAELMKLVVSHGGKPRFNMIR